MLYKPDKKKVKLSLAAPQWAVLLFVASCLTLLFWDMGDGSLAGSLTAEAPVVDLPSALEEETAAPVLAQAGGDGQSATPAVSQTAAADQAETAGETTESAAAFFARYRLEREQTKARELELLEETLNSTESSQQAKTDAAQSKLALTENLSAELKAETILEAKEFGENVVIIGVKQATVVLDCPIDAVKALQIAQIVDGVCGIGYETVIIVNR